jgi:hypothetical protein
MNSLLDVLDLLVQSPLVNSDWHSCSNGRRKGSLRKICLLPNLVSRAVVFCKEV